jgi:hypothetical protein
MLRNLPMDSLRKCCRVMPMLAVRKTGRKWLDDAENDIRERKGKKMEAECKYKGGQCF